MEQMVILDEVFNCIYENKDKPFYLKSACNPADIFTWKDVEKHINNNLHSTDIVSIGNDSSKKNVYVTLLPSTDDRQNLFREIIDGNSFILNGMERYTTGLFYVSNLLSLIHNSYVTTNIYGGLTNFSKSFPIHADPQYVLILQLDGICEWTIYNETWNGEASTCIVHDESIMSECMNVTMEVGDILYIPFARYHRCIPKSKRLSASISVDYNSVRPKNYGEWFSLN